MKLQNPAKQSSQFRSKLTIIYTGEKLDLTVINTCVFIGDVSRYDMVNLNRIDL